MIIDDVIWEVINNGHCSYKVKTVTNTFCKNPYNLTGLCNRNSCPLANSRYATIQEEKGVCYLLMKTPERAHTPNELWEKIQLDKSYKKALEQIEQNLEFWPDFIKHKAKQRFTRIRQVLIKKKRMKLEGNEEYEVISRKAEKREKSRLQKAEKSSMIEMRIEEELLKNLKSGKYDAIYNYPMKSYEQALEEQETMKEKEEEFDSDDLENVFAEEDFEGEEGENGEGSEGNDERTKGSSFTKKKRKREAKGKKPKLNIEFEKEREQQELDLEF